MAILIHHILNILPNPHFLIILGHSLKEKTLYHLIKWNTGFNNGWSNSCASHFLHLGVVL